MFDDLTAYFYENVVSSYDDYFAIKNSREFSRSKDVRLAMIAASALFHLREHLPAEHRCSRKKVEDLCADYVVLGDVVNASKHNSVSLNTPHGSPLVTSAAQISEQLIVTLYEDELGTYRSLIKDVIVDFADGTARSVSEVLRNVMNFWQIHLHSIGVIENPRSYVVVTGREPKTRKECERYGVHLGIVKGLRFKMCLKLMKYNYEKHMAEPMDLTGCQARMTIRRPLYDVDLFLKHKESGHDFKATVSLTEQESEVVLGFETEAEKQAYIHSLPHTQEAFRRLIEEAGLESNPSASAAAKADPS